MNMLELLSFFADVAKSYLPSFTFTHCWPQLWLVCDVPGQKKIKHVEKLSVTISNTSRGWDYWHWYEPFEKAVAQAQRTMNAHKTI